MPDRRRCYYIDEAMTNEQGHLVPAVVEEDDPGYTPVNYSWDTDITQARVWVDRMNADLGLTVNDAREIVSSSLRAQNKEVVTAHIILVAFAVEAVTRKEAYTALDQDLSKIRSGSTVSAIHSWWVAEDDRTDGSDCDSAVFVPPGSQECVSQYLAEKGATPAHNVVQRDSIFECQHGSHDG